MKTNIKATGMELTPAIREFIDEKLGQVEKFVVGNPDALAQVEVGKVTHHNKGEDVFRAEIHITGGGLDLYAVSKKSDLYLAVNDVKEEIVKELSRGKDRDRALHRRGAKMIKDMMHGVYRRFRR